MGSYKSLYYAVGAMGTGSAIYFLTRHKEATPPTTPLHGSKDCKYILDNSHSHTFDLSDGRKLGYADYGDPSGKPILYQHGLPGSRIEATRYHDLGKELGLRIFSIDRPGHGWSSAFEKYGARTVKSWAEDVNELAEGLGLSEYAVMVCQYFPSLYHYCSVSGNMRLKLTCTGCVRRRPLRALSRLRPS